MVREFRLPDIGEGLTEAVIVHWHAGVGDDVAADGPLVEVETDKAVVDIPSPHGGVLLHQGAAEGETLAVGELLAVIGDAGETWAPPERLGGETIAPEPVAPIVGRLDEATDSGPMVSGRAGMLPRTRRLATELGVDPDHLTGTGAGGRVTDEDVRTAAASPATAGPVRRVRMSPTRRSIAEHLARSWREIPHVTTYAAADAVALLAERDRLGKPPLEALLVARLLPALAAFPDFNASVIGDEIVHKLYYDIGVAVDTDDGLLVTVIRGAPSFTLSELAAEIARLAAAARERAARPEELRGQTFTLSNIGAVGGGYGTPIVPYGTTAILSVGRADPRPVVRGDRIDIGRELPLSLSYDHRAIDGSTGRAFMAAVVEAFEAPGSDRT